MTERVSFMCGQSGIPRLAKQGNGSNIHLKVTPLVSYGFSDTSNSKLRGMCLKEPNEKGNPKKSWQ